VQFYQSSSLHALELDYRVLLRSWDCDFHEFFRGDDFALDAAARYPAVRSYVQDRILDDLCLNATDWEVFMERTPVADVTATQARRAKLHHTSASILLPPAMTMRPCPLGNGATGLRPATNAPTCQKPFAGFRRRNSRILENHSWKRLPSGLHGHALSL
jgi:hypothetical protein